MQQRVVGDPLAEVEQLLVGGQFAVDQQPRDLEEGALGGELLDGVAAVAQDPLLAVDEGDGAGAGTRVGEARVEGDQARLLAELADVDRPLPFRALDDGQGDLPAVDVQSGLTPGKGRRGLMGHGSTAPWTLALPPNRSRPNPPLKPCRLDRQLQSVRSAPGRLGGTGAGSGSPRGEPARSARALLQDDRLDRVRLDRVGAPEPRRIIACPTR